MFKKTLIAAIMMSSLGAVSTYATADIVVRVAPPAPRAEMVPQARRGYVWSPGHWEWRNQRHVWTNGKWLRDRPGYSYQSPAWAERNGRWAMQSGRWERAQENRNGRGYGRDRDGDGVRNNQDRDRDGDGVRNNRDARPNNPNLR